MLLVQIAGLLWAGSCGLVTWVLVTWVLVTGYAGSVVVVLVARRKIQRIKLYVVKISGTFARIHLDSSPAYCIYPMAVINALIWRRIEFLYQNRMAPAASRDTAASKRRVATPQRTARRP